MFYITYENNSKHKLINDNIHNNKSNYEILLKSDYELIKEIYITNIQEDFKDLNTLIDKLINLKKISIVYGFYDLLHKNHKYFNITLFYNCKNLEVLNLYCNNLFHIDKNILTSCCKLQKIDLSHNKISYLNKNTFTHLHNLTYLNLSFNNLKTIDFNLFMFNKDLEYLFLDNNEIYEIIENDKIQFLNLKVLLLHNNNLTNVYNLNKNNLSINKNIN
jgi:Leucine-rich repeat (LRR) protein